MNDHDELNSLVRQVKTLRNTNNLLSSSYCVDDILIEETNKELIKLEQELNSLKELSEIVVENIDLQEKPLDKVEENVESANINVINTIEKFEIIESHYISTNAKIIGGTIIGGLLLGGVGSLFGIIPAIAGLGIGSGTGYFTSYFTSNYLEKKTNDVIS